MSARMLGLVADVIDGGEGPSLRRRQVVEQHPTPLDLASRFDQTTVRTPALELLASRLIEAATSRNGRLVVAIAPQEGKTTLLRWLCTWLLIDDPRRRIVFASHAAELARDSGRTVRTQIDSHAQVIGITVSRDQANAADWRLRGHRGGMLAVGVGSSLTGRPADVLVVDDALAGQAEADSPVIRSRLHSWWSSVARTRLAPGAPVIVVATRWHEDDLSGRLLDEGWPLVNIPALADGHTADALDRPAGEWMTSARGRSVEDWDSTRRDVGERTFAALYQGRPAPLEGGTFREAWFDTWRQPTAPEGCVPPTVYVDPADNEGDGDEAGIILATYHPPTRTAYVLADLSASMTVARWARLGLLTCARHGAPRLAFERSLSQLRKRICEAWDHLHAQARAVRAAAGDHDAALARLIRTEDGAAARHQIAAELAELTDDDVTAVLGFGPAGPGLHSLTARGSKELRMQLVAPAFETGRAVMVGRHPALEHQAVTWSVGQDSPDRVDAMVHAVTDLLGMSAPATVTRAGRGNKRIPMRTAASAATGPAARR